MGTEIENAIIGHSVGECVETEVKIPEQISYVRDICGSNMKIVIDIKAKKGKVDPGSITPDIQLNNYKIAYDKVWNAYYQIALKKMLSDGVGNKDDYSDTELDDSFKRVNSYFDDYCSRAQLSKHEYMEDYLNINEDQYNDALERFAYYDLVKKDIDSLADEYKAGEMNKLEKDESRWLFFK